MNNHSSVFAAAFTSNENNSLVNYSFDDDDDDDDDIQELLRINGIRHPPPATQTNDNSQRIHRQQQHVVVTPKAAWNDNHHNFDTHNTTTLPPALLKLDQQHAIPTLRHCNDILIEIEACTIEPRRCMIRSGVRGGNNGGRKQYHGSGTAAKEDGKQQQQLMDVVTTSVDCIGRVVQLAEKNDCHQQQRQQKIHNDIQVNDRIAAIHPFEYKLDKKNQLSQSRQNNHNDISNHQRYTLVDAGFCCMPDSSVHYGISIIATWSSVTCICDEFVPDQSAILSYSTPRKVNGESIEP
eukprot:scaffold29298_cov152-Skeletonema_dohrnii-CCMP3373.AAC.6